MIDPNLRKLILSERRKPRNKSNTDDHYFSAKNIQITSSVFTAAGVIIVFVLWILEANDREIAREVATQTLIRGLHQEIDELANLDENPASKFRAGRAIEQLGRLGEEITIFGNDVEIAGLDLTCATIRIHAKSVKLYDFTLQWSNLTITAGEIGFENGDLVNSQVDLGKFDLSGGPPVLKRKETLTLDKSNLVDTVLYGASFKNTTINQTFSNSLGWLDTNGITVRDSFFVERLPHNSLSNQSSTYENVGFFPSDDSGYDLAIQVRRRGQKLDDLFTNDERSSIRSDAWIDTLCVYSASKSHIESNPKYCPPSGVTTVSSTYRVIDGDYGLDVLFRNGGSIPNQWLIKEMQGKTKFRHVPPQRYFHQGFVPNEILFPSAAFEKLSPFPC